MHRLVYVASLPPASLFVRRTMMYHGARSRKVERENATILIVEDDASLRTACRRLLERDCYAVIAAADGHEAILLANAFSARIDLILTDMVLPGLSGCEIVARLRSKRPDIRVLYMSGYADDEICRRGLPNESVRLLEKPFTAIQLLNAVRASLHLAPDR